jgi:hypothetical protein
VTVTRNPSPRLGCSQARVSARRSLRHAAASGGRLPAHLCTQIGGLIGTPQVFRRGQYRQCAHLGGRTLLSMSRTVLLPRALARLCAVVRGELPGNQKLPSSCDGSAQGCAFNWLRRCGDSRPRDVYGPCMRDRAGRPARRRTRLPGRGHHPAPRSTSYTVLSIGVHWIRSKTSEITLKLAHDESHGEDFL